MSRIDHLPGTPADADDAREPASEADVNAHDDPRIVAIVQEYLAAAEMGKPLNRRELLARHPDIARELNDCLSSLAFLRAAAGGIHGDGNESPNRAANPAADAELAEARPLGDFRLIREIGRGGMGVVYEAFQLSLGRRVAVKVLSMAAALDARQLQRFRNEAQAAAQLHHTNIVPVHAVGCERSVHFYAMQLIEGRSLSELIEEMRGKVQETPRRPAHSGDAHIGVVSHSFDVEPERSVTRVTSRTTLLNGVSTTAAALSVDTVNASTLPLLRSSRRAAFYRTVARLGAQAAEALDYAHRAGVVHRDVKPANLLLDEAGVLWMTDFGLAQLQSDHQLTQAGETVGTLQYMSPEQASGRAVVLDQRTDIYSLGATLYELLTLERAFTGTTREQLLWKIENEEPRSPRLIDRSIPPELETILTTAMAKDPAERYATARAFAEDLSRFLSDEPIRARRPSWRSRLFKWGRRHRGLVAAAVVMSVLAAVGLLVSTVLVAREQTKTQAAYERERLKAIEADRERIKADRERTMAQKSFAQARDAVSFLGRVAIEDLVDIPDAAAVRKEMLEAALDYHQGFLEDHGADPGIGEQLSEAEANVANILSELSAVEEFDRVQTRLKLLSEASVAAALKLTSEQEAQLRALKEPRWRLGDAFKRVTVERAAPEDEASTSPDPARGRGSWNLSSRERSDVFSMVANEAEADVAKVLSPGQSMRLSQISRQVRGAAAFSDPDVAAALGLSREQRDQVRRSQAEARRSQREAQRRGPWERRDDSERMREIRETTVRQIVQKLTPAQVRTLGTLTGEPFNSALSLDQPFRGGFGPGGPGRSANPSRGPGPINPPDRTRPGEPPMQFPPGERRDRREPPRPEREKEKTNETPG